MRTTLFILVFLSLLIPASIIRAQKITQEKGLTTAVFNLPQGKIKVYLPDDIRQGDVISGTVTATPDGKNEKQLERNLSELIKYSIALYGVKLTIERATTIIRFMVPTDRPMQVAIELLSVGGTKSVQQLSIPTRPVSEQKPAPAQCALPDHVLVGTHMMIPGPFDGNAANTQCSIGNQPATVIAESPRTCIVDFPQQANGMQATQVKEEGQQPCTKNVSGVQMDVSAGKLNLVKGEQTYIEVSITGLQSLQTPAMLLLSNLTTDVVAMLPSNTIAIPLLPDSVSTGNFNRRFTIESSRTGGFVVNVKLDFQDIMMTPMPEEPKKDDKVPPALSDQNPDEPKFLVVGENIYKLPVDSIPDKKLRSCSRSTAKDILPKMDGGLKLGIFGSGETQVLLPAKRTIKRDEFIPLVAEGADFDTFIIQCSPTEHCAESTTVKLVPLAGRVRFEWQIVGGTGRGQFVKLGCLYTKNNDGQKTEGEQVIFMPPVLQLPVFGTGKETVVTTKIILSIIDDNASLKDVQVDREFEIITRRTIEYPDAYKIDIIYKHTHTVTRPVSKDAENKCEAIAGAWDKKTDLIPPTIKLPDVQDNKKMVLGQWIVLEVEDQHETDVLSGIVCGTTCGAIVASSITQEDNVHWKWAATGGKGRFVGGNTGRFVIYEAPTTLPGDKTEIEVVFTVIASNQGGAQAPDDETESAGIKIMVYQPGIKMHYPSQDWVPGYNKTVTLKSELQYNNKGKWEPALAHMGRILFFELINVSQERGIMMNDPLYNQADNCLDLQFMNSEIERNFEVFAPVDFKKKILSKCTLTDQFMMLRTVKPLQNFEVEVYSLDFGSYGFLRSFANTNSVNGVEEKPPFYKSIPWLKTELFHPLTTDKVPRLKAKEHTDNRVTIPVDIDENHIPDAGWLSISGVVPDPLKNNVDEDKLPVGNKTNGDGLTTYEEYRGFKVLNNKDAAPIRLHPGKKDIFIYNKNELDISLFKSVTGLEVHQIKAENLLPELYKEDARAINFNINKGSPTHLINQRALRLVDGGDYSGLLGIACGASDCPPPGTVAPPNWIYEIRIYSTAIARACSLRGMNPKEKMAQVIAHELCHGINICHHGEGNPNIEGDFEKLHGLRSGDINCIMRYDNAGKKITLQGTAETIGSDLCSSPEGTGYNLPGNRPGFERARTGAGNCIHQIHVTGAGAKPVPCKQ